MRVRCAIAAASALLGCAAGAGPWDIGHRGPGRVAIVYERQDPDLGLTHELLVYDASGARRVAVPDPQSAHWLGRGALLVALRSRTAAEDYRTPVQLHRVDLASGASQPLGAAGFYFDLAPDPSGALLALGVEAGDLGDSELQIWDLAAPGEPLARRAQTLDRPRWSPNGRQLVVSQPRPDSDEAEIHDGVSIEGVTISWSRLFRLRRDLIGRLRALYDGPPGGSLVPGGTLPLWWDDQGIWARQRAGLVRCNPDGSGCLVIYEPGALRSVVDGCAASGNAWLIVRRGESGGAATEIHRVSIEGWGGSHVVHAPAGRSVAGIDCAD
jgi:hypothetical protein